jgi:iron(III) transport system ATP-binding protein
MARIDLVEVAKTFGATRAVDRVDLVIPHGEFVAILGPSGCGKTTLLRLLAGLERVDEGSIRVDGALVSSAETHVPPEKRNVGVVFQSYALWPHMTVAENAAYPLRVARVPPTERAAATHDALAAVELDALAQRLPHELSGGQQQRVALARCLTAKPGLVLMDEPLANLDMHLRERMLAEFRAFHARSGATILYITHDQAEAMSVADRIGVMQGGRLVQVAAPEELYQAPATVEVAQFIGVASIVPGRVALGTINRLCRVDALGLTVQAQTASDLRTGDGALLVVRPEAVILGDRGVTAVVQRSAYLGGRFLIEIEADGHRLKAYADRRVVPGERVGVSIASAWALPGPPLPQRSLPHGSTPAGKRFEIA